LAFGIEILYTITARWAKVKFKVSV